LAVSSPLLFDAGFTVQGLQAEADCRLFGPGQVIEIAHPLGRKVDAIESGVVGVVPENGKKPLTAA
jgi:hypothetical protein